MPEIEKLRQRLKNVNKNTVEYRMTVNEARQLLSEIDLLVTPIIVSAPEQKPYESKQIKIMDGGTF